MTDMLRSSLLCLGLLALSVPAAAQAAWTELAPTTRPQPRAGVAAVFDGAGLLFFSGNLGPSGVPSQYPGDLWRFDGTNWTQLSPNPDPANGLPAGREWYAAAFDFSRGVYVMFGGRDGGGLMSAQTWEYNVATNTWALRQPATTSPTPRRWAAMAYHAATNECVMFGGETANSSTYTDQTWTWNGVDWTLENPSNKPSSRGRGKMAYDPFRQETLYTCGRNAAILGDTWIWDGSDWRSVATTNAPGAFSPAFGASASYQGPGLFAFSLTFDLARRRYVLHGGTRRRRGQQGWGARRDRRRG